MASTKLAVDVPIASREKVDSGTKFPGDFSVVDDDTRHPPAAVTIATYITTTILGLTIRSP